jgi:hypothetical protein
MINVKIKVLIKKVGVGLTTARYFQSGRWPWN